MLINNKISKIKNVKKYSSNKIFKELKINKTTFKCHIKYKNSNIRKLEFAKIDRTTDEDNYSELL